MGVYKRSPLLPSKDEYISTYAGIPIEQTEKFLADANKRFYDNIGATSKVRAALAQMDLLEGDDPLKQEWGDKISKHIDGVAKDEGAWENAGFNTAMLASNFVGDESLQKGLQNKGTYDKHVEKLNGWYESGKINKKQLDYYTQNPLDLYQGAKGGDDMAKYLGDPAQAVDINKLIAQFDQIKAADMKSSGWKWDEENMYYYKNTGEVKYPQDIRKELKEFIYANPGAQQYIDEMNTLDPEFADQLTRTIDGAAEAIGYEKWDQQIRFSPTGKKLGKGKSNTKIDRLSTEIAVISPEATVTSTADHFKNMASLERKVDLGKESITDNNTNFVKEVEAVNEPNLHANVSNRPGFSMTGGDDVNPGKVTFTDDAGNVVPYADLPKSVQTLYGNYIAEDDRYIKEINSARSKITVDNSIYEVANAQANAEFQQIRPGQAVPDKGTLAKLGQDFFEDRVTWHAQKALQSPDAGGAFEVNQTEEQNKYAEDWAKIAEGDLSMFQADQLDDIMSRAEDDMNDDEEFYNYVAETDPQSADYISLLNRNIESMEAPSLINERMFTLSGGETAALTNYWNLQQGEGADAVTFMATSNPTWFGSDPESSGSALTAEELENIMGSGEASPIAYVYNSIEDKYKIVYDVKVTDSNFFGADDILMKKVVVDAPREMIPQLVKENNFSQVMGEVGGATGFTLGLIKAKLAATTQKYQSEGEINNKTRAGTTRTGKFDSPAGPIGYTLSPERNVYVVTWFDGSQNRSGTFRSEEQAANKILSLYYSVIGATSESN